MSPLFTDASYFQCISPSKIKGTIVHTWFGLESLDECVIAAYEDCIFLMFVSGDNLGKSYCVCYDGFGLAAALPSSGAIDSIMYIGKYTGSDLLCNIFSIFSNWAYMMIIK